MDHRGEKRKSKVQASRKQPSRSDFTTQRDFERAWAKWRASRDNNNNSVKRSRQHLRAEQSVQEQLCSAKTWENEQLESEVHSLHSDAHVLLKAMTKPATLSKDELDRVKFMMREEQAKDPEAVAPPSASGLMSSILADSILYPV